MLKNAMIFLLFVLFSIPAYADCDELMAKYHSPDPAKKTMKQLKRWVKRKVKDGNAKELKECLVARAADNPNKATVAGH
jgi:hypothetical protein